MSGESERESEPGRGAVLQIKICGVTLPGDAARVAAAGADFIGLNFWPRSKRHVDADRAASLAAAVRGAGWATGLLVLSAGTGLAAEVLGVRTGFPFGEYAYTDALQPQVLGVPVVVPLA